MELSAVCKACRHLPITDQIAFMWHTLIASLDGEGAGWMGHTATNENTKPIWGGVRAASMQKEPKIKKTYWKHGEECDEYTLTPLKWVCVNITDLIKTSWWKFADWPLQAEDQANRIAEKNFLIIPSYSIVDDCSPTAVSVWLKSLRQVQDWV